MASPRFGHLKYCLTLALVTICSNAFGAAIVPESEAREIARTAIGRGNETFFSVHRREDLEDILCSLASVDANTPSTPPCAFLFELSDEAYEFTQRKVHYHISVHGPFIYYVVVSRGSGDAFRISGFKDSQNEFNRMAKAYQIKVSTDWSASQYLELYRDVDPANARIEMPNSNLEFKQLAEKRFGYAYSDFDTADVHFDHWWKNTKTRMIGHTFGPIISHTKTAFLITFLTLSDIDKGKPDSGPGVLRASIEISADGQITGPASTPIAQ